MAVYTEVSGAALRAFLTDYTVGELLSKTPIAEGVENTNYRIETTDNPFILTLFEKRTRAEDLPFFMELTDHLSRAGLPVAAPVANRRGEFIGELASRPAAIIEFLPGRPKMSPNPEDCHAAGSVLGSLHEAVADFSGKRGNPLSIGGWRKLIADCAPYANECEHGLARFIEEEFREIETNWPNDLPGGVVHTDLFPDNVLFSGGDITGVIDFYFSANDSFAYDLAVTLNAWCFDKAGSFSAGKARALIGAYREKRRLAENELAALPILLRGAALRFLLTRLYDWLNRVEGAIVNVKDPLEYKKIILFHRAGGGSALAGLAS